MTLEVGADPINPPTEGEYGPPVAGRFAWPRPGGPGAFGRRRTTRHTHQGVDLGVPRGRPWLAIADGRIVRVVTQPTPAAGFSGYGRVVVLRHKDRASGRDVFALYAHGDAVTVRVGQEVRKGHELGKTGNSQFYRNPSAHRPEGSMGVHLHFELSTHSYPQGSEAPTRVDPVQFLRSHGAPGMPAAPSTTEDQATRTPDASPEDLPAKVELRRELMNRLARTDVRVALVRAQLVAAGHPMVAEALGAAWAPSRARLWALLASPSRLSQIHDAVNEWLARIDTLAEQARALVPDAMRAVVERVRAELRAIWEAGIDWAETSLPALARRILGAGLMGGSALFILAALWAWSKTSKTRR